MSQILRYLTYGEKQGEQFTNDAVADATQALSTPMAYTRLLVISGTIPTIVLKFHESLCRFFIWLSCDVQKNMDVSDGLKLENL